MTARHEIITEQDLHTFADDMASAMAAIANNARSEEDVRHECNKLIEQFCAMSGLEPIGRHEYGLAGGRLDSKYGGVLIEYKMAGKIGSKPSAPGARAVVDQLRQRFRDFHIDEKIEPERLFGVGTDAEHLVYVRQRGDELVVEGPFAVSAFSVIKLLRALLSVLAKGRSFTPSNLAEHFGAESALAQQDIRSICAVLRESRSEKVKTLFMQWKTLFGEVCGYDVEGKSEKIRRLSRHYGVPEANPAELLFTLHTYYAIVIKLLSAEIVAGVSPLALSVLQRCGSAATSSQLRDEIDALESGGIWKQVGVTNFLEGDLFAWYLDAWDDRIAGVMGSVLQRMLDYDPRTLSVEPSESHDLLKHLYQRLFPRSVRHDLGEYYTPDWLAELTLDEVGFDGCPDKRVLDPACGSGTFLVAVIGKIRSWYDEHRHECGFGDADLLKRILKNIIGFDLNPLAVMAARTNYLLAIRDLLRFGGKIELPVYLCDTVLTPSEYGTLFRHEDESRVLKTAAGFFQIPAQIAANQDALASYTTLLEQCADGGCDSNEFLARVSSAGLSTIPTKIHTDLYEKLVELKAAGKNGVWARIIKNAFAPLFVNKVDFVVGNPPWINWESLPAEYRHSIKPLWKDYGLFSLTGSRGRLGGGKKDLSMLFVYVCADNYLDYGGRLGFVITQTVFKTKGAGDGFRRLRYSTRQRAVLRPTSVHDLSRVQVFEGATNRTAVLTCTKQKEDFHYPVPYMLWLGPPRISQDLPLDEVIQSAFCISTVAAPVDPHKMASPWLTLPERAMPGVRKVIGSNRYRAYEGANTGGLNGCFWIKILRTLKDEVLIQNLHDVGKIKVKQVPPTAIESDLVYPLLRGRDARYWSTEPSAHIILAQDPEKGKGIAEPLMKQHYLKTYSYLKLFEGKKDKPERGTLRGRALYKQYFEPTDPFYSMYDVGTYTLSKWKVTWPEVGNSIRAGVCGPMPDDGARVAIPAHTVVFIPCRSGREAHYVCAVLNSSPVQALVLGHLALHPSPHVLELIKIPTYDPQDECHLALADLSRQCHGAVKAGDVESRAMLEQSVDITAAKLLGISSAELMEVQAALNDLRNEGCASDEEALGVEDCD